MWKKSWPLRLACYKRPIMVPCISLYSENVFACSCSGNGYGFPGSGLWKNGTCPEVLFRQVRFGGGTAIPVVLNIQFWIPDCDMNIIREAGSCWLYLSEYGPCSVPADEDILSASIPVNALRSCHGTKKICYERIMTVCTGMNHSALSGLFSRIPFVPEAVAYQ